MSEAQAAAAGAVGAMTYLQWFSGLMTGAAWGSGAMAIVARVRSGREAAAHGQSRVAGTVCASGFFGGGSPWRFCFMPLGGPIPYWCGCSACMTRPAEKSGMAYLRIMCWTICFQTAGMIGMACLRAGAGDTYRPMLVTGAITLVNGVASWALTFGKLGAAGNAWGIRGNATGTTCWRLLCRGLLTFGFLLSGAGRKFEAAAATLSHYPACAEAGGEDCHPASWLEESLLLWGGQTSVVLLSDGAGGQSNCNGIGRRVRGRPLGRYTSTGVAN